MKTQPAHEILISALRVNPEHRPDWYEFVLDDTLRITECVQVTSLNQGIISPVKDFSVQLHDVLFELNHVRVNPSLDNTLMIEKLTQAFENIGVRVHNRPNAQSMAVCYRPLGEIRENVRFYFQESRTCIFLCPKAKLKAVG